MKKSPHAWRGIFPPLTTPMHRDASLDPRATTCHADALITSGVTVEATLNFAHADPLLDGIP